MSFVAAHTGATTCIAISGDDSKIVSGGEDGRIFVFLFLFCQLEMKSLYSLTILDAFCSPSSTSSLFRLSGIHSQVIECRSSKNQRDYH